MGAYPNPVMLIGLRTTKRVQVKLNHNLILAKYAHHAKSLYLDLFVVVSSQIYFPNMAILLNFSIAGMNSGTIYHWISLEESKQK